MVLAVAYELAIGRLQVRVFVRSTRALSEFSPSHRQKHIFTPRSFIKSMTCDLCLKKKTKTERGSKEICVIFLS